MIQVNTIKLFCSGPQPRQHKIVHINTQATVKIWNKIITLIFDMDISHGEFKKKIFIRLKI